LIIFQESIGESELVYQSTN